ncbi:MAG: thymidine phosphorylase [Candidatus Acetothermia bacterium]|jgi:pyrimidine-nucleoside phosphorylase|nr:thymidine phosphorylase [Candidatus Acetothermia bacterium]MDH7505693.1 thymidine phosphorylase [Candidatus Acetothermia bacterium]
MRTIDLIQKKRDGGRLTREEIAQLIAGFVREEIPDYQMSALLMAIYLRGMDREETLDLTEAMARSGRRLKFDVDGFVADKHSSGGVGDKVSLVLVPLIASAGLFIGKLSGRGLGHTGGTIDKLESIPGFCAALPLAEFKRQVAEVGAAIAESSSEIAPADHKLYALRDATATVSSLPLIASSIMSKKLAIDSDGLVLDVKVGRGALMETEERAEELARLMVDLGQRAGRKTAALITAMDQPLGRMVGNALELREALSALEDQGPQDLEELTLELGAELLLMAGQAHTRDEGKTKLRQKLRDGSALAKLQELVARQGGDPRALEDPELLPQARGRLEVKARQPGYIKELDALAIGEAAHLLGAGRTAKGQALDHAVGIELLKKVGDHVALGEPVALVHYNSEERLALAKSKVEAAFTVGAEPPAPEALIRKRIA